MAAPNEKLSQKDEATLNRIFNPHLPFSDVPQEDVNDNEDEEETEAVIKAKDLELQGVKAAEAGDVMQALDLFNQAIQAAPHRASGYNNRAQALRLKGDVDGAIDDLDKAIGLSGGKGKAACQSYTQRGLIRRLEGQDEAAMEDFKKAAALGGQFAKEMVVVLNPYAALCNQMLAEMFQKVKQGEM